jgi:hypothetical protein
VAIAHFSKVFACEDAKVYPMTADTGGAPTYGSGIDVPGVKSLEISGSIDRKSLRGDNRLLDIFAVLTDVTGRLNHAKLSLDMLAAQLGGTVVDSGTTPNQKATWSLTSTSAPKYWKIEAKTPTDGVDMVGGDLHVLFYKCVLSSFPGLGLAEEDYQIPGLEFGTVAALSNGKWMDVVVNETFVAIT